MLRTYRTLLVLLSSALAAAACGGSGSPADGEGFLALGITDAPVDDVLEVNVQFTGVTLKPQSGDEIEIVFDTPKDIDLLSLTDGTTAEVLPSTALPAGRYNWVRLAVNAEFDSVFDSYAVLPTGQVELRVPSGSQNGLKLVSGFNVLANGTTNLVIDWDLRKALSNPAGQPGLHLRPALRITDLAEFGTLAGVVDAALINAAECSNDVAADTGNAVYVHEGLAVTPGDIDDALAAPFATATVQQNQGGAYEYRVSFLPPGNYTAAFTCQASDDLVDNDDDIDFSAAQDFAITDGVTTDVNF